MTIEVYRATAYMIDKYDGYEENGRTLRFVGNEVKYISLQTPDFFPSIATNLKKMNKILIEIDGSE